MSGTKHPVSDSTLQALWYLPWNNRSEQLHQDSFHWSLRETTSSLSSLSLLKHVIICNKLQLLSQFYWFIVLGWDWKHFYHLVFAIIFAPGYGTCDDVKRLLNHLYELAVPRSSTLSGPHVGLAFHFWFLLLFVTAPCADPLSEKLNAGKVGIFFLLQKLLCPEIRWGCSVLWILHSVASASGRLNQMSVGSISDDIYLQEQKKTQDTGNKPKKTMIFLCVDVWIKFMMHK